MASEASAAELKQAFQPTLTVDSMASICHEANRQFCESLGDFSQVPWEAADEAIKYSAMHGVKYILASLHSGRLPHQSELHAQWCKVKESQGWKYGPVKDSEKKEHPCLVEYSKLPQFQQAKDSLFQAIVISLYSTGMPIDIGKISNPGEQKRIIIPS
jgi:hypothetical protein